MLRSAGNTPYRPVGFITDGKEPAGFDVAGLRVRPLNEKLFDWMQARKIQHVIVSPVKMREINPAKDLQIFIDHNIHILTTPYFTPVDNTNDIDAERIGRIDSIRIEDLLERPQIEVNTENVRQIIRDKVVLISGAAGSIGSELVRQVQQFEPKATILLEMAESPLHDLTLDLHQQFPKARFIPIIADVRNRERIEQIFSELRPDVIYHAAAYKHVPLMESFPNEAIQANVLGTKNMADMAVKFGVERFVMISTDKAVNPTNIMGASKRIAEIYVQSLFHKLQKADPGCTKFITTRFGNVLGSNGSVIPYFRKQIASGGPVTVTHPDIIRYFMTIPEACCLVMEASTLGNGGEIFVFDMGQPVKILDLARNMIRLAGYTPEKDIPIVFTGLRPGEKLYEELLNQKELTLPTTNNKIMIARVREFDFDQINGQIDQLIATSHQDKIFTTVKIMKELVPEYISKNSVYERLDIQ
jgi:FlaA1/EpsC-like NDP-sugar epimerase